MSIAICPVLIVATTAETKVKHPGASSLFFLDRWFKKFCRRNVSAIFLAWSGTFFKIADPTGDCPEHGHGCFGLVEVAALGKNPVIFL